MDDEKFKLFENWYLKRKEKWAKKGIFIESAELSEFGHQYWIKIYSQNGLGNIVLYESNHCYWVDFEAGNITSDIMFCKGNLPFDKEDDIALYEKELIEYMV